MADLLYETGVQVPTRKMDAQKIARNAAVCNLGYSIAV